MEMLASEIESLQQNSKDSAERETRYKLELRQSREELEIQREATSKSARTLQKERETLESEIQRLSDEV